MSRDRGSSYVLPVGPSILISLLDELHSELAAAFDAHVAAHGVPGNSGAKAAAADASSEAAWRAFPRSCAFYAPQIARLASVASCIKAEQMLTEVTLQWIPPSAGAATGAAFSRSQFDFAHFQERLKCVSKEPGRNVDAPRIIELVQTIVGVTVRPPASFTARRVVRVVGGRRRRGESTRARAPPCDVAWACTTTPRRAPLRPTRRLTHRSANPCQVCDVLHELLAPRDGAPGAALSADTAHAIIQLSFQQFKPQARASATRACHRTRRSA